MGTEGLQLEPPRRVTIVDSIIEQLVAQIRNGALKPGERLPSERRLMEMLNVSRSSVREALQGLAAMDLVEGRAGEGTFIKEVRRLMTLGPDITTLSTALQREMRHHVNQARLVLEEGIVSMAAADMDAAKSQGILEALADYEATRADVESDQSWTAHDHLHLAIAEATGNPVLVRMLTTLIYFVPDTLRKKGFLDGTPADASRRIEAELLNHRNLVAAILKGDVAGAMHWIREHATQEGLTIDEYYGH